MHIIYIYMYVMLIINHDLIIERDAQPGAQFPRMITSSKLTVGSGKSQILSGNLSSNFLAGSMLIYWRVS